MNQPSEVFLGCQLWAVFHFSSLGFSAGSGKCYSWFWCTGLCWGIGRNPRQCSISLELYFGVCWDFGVGVAFLLLWSLILGCFLVSVFLIPNTLWVTLSDCFSILPLATGAVYFTFSSEDLTLLSLNASFGLSALASLSSNLVCSSHFASKRHVNFLHLIIFVLSFASPFLATRVYLSLHLLPRIMFDFAHIPHFGYASDERDCIVWSRLSNSWEIMLPFFKKTLCEVLWVSSG